MKRLRRWRVFLGIFLAHYKLRKRGLRIVMPRQRFSAQVSSPSFPTILVEKDVPSPLTRPVDDLFSATYEELRRMARFVKREYGQATLSPTTLVNEAWLKFAASRALEFESVLHFKLTAARAMRQILVEAARRQMSDKRGGGEVIFIVFDEMATPMRCDRQIVALNESLDELAQLNPRQALLVESRYFGGLEIAEVAALLNVSEATVSRDWRAARAWLGAEVRRRV